MIVAAYSLPTSRIYHNVERSVKIYEREGEYPYWAGGVTHTRMDNITDAIMLMKAAYPVKNLIDSAFLNPSWSLDDKLPAHALINIVNQHRDAGDETWNYARYWHGYLVILKPALMIAPLTELRVLNFYVQFFLTITLLILIYKKLGLSEMYAFGLAAAVINPITAAINLQLTDVYGIILLSAIFILMRNDLLMRGENYLYFFAIIGIVTAYVDFLSYPFAAFGISLCFCVMMNKNFFFHAEAKQILIKLSTYLFSWGFGYLGMWSSKWILATLLTNENVLLEAMNAGILRTGLVSYEPDGIISFTPVEVFERSFEGLIRGPMPVILVLLIFYLLYLLIVKKKKIYATKSMKLTFGVICLLPCLWLLIFKNHSYVHDFMAYRNWAITILAATWFFIEAFKEKI